MKLIIAMVMLVLPASAAVAEMTVPSSLESVAWSLSSVASSAIPLPEAAGRKGSKRVGGYTSKGKGSHYVGGRR